MNAPNPRTLKPGTRVPNLTLRTRDGGNWDELRTQDLFSGRKVVVFSLPGAFTPTCSSSHVPRYVELKSAFERVGVDEIVCVSVNDAFVMEAWQQDQGAEAITFLPDGNGLFTDALGMLVDKSDLGFGKRSWRYAMVVEDGVVTQAFVEPDVPGDPFEVSDADTVLKALGGSPDPDILLFTKPTCGHCARAKAALDEAGLAYEELPANPRILASLPGPKTTPQVYIDGAHLGGADALIAWLADRS